MAAAATSDQNVLTADEFEKSPESLTVVLSLDDESLPCQLLHDTWIFSQDQLRFAVEVQTSVTFTRDAEHITTRLVLEVGAAEPAYWDLLYQARIHLDGLTVDQFNVDFGITTKSVTVDLADETVRTVRLELKTLNQLYWPLPRFESDGDVTLLFDQDPPLRTWRALLASCSAYMSERLTACAQSETVHLGDFRRADMEQLLLQLYPTNWPYYMNYPGLARAAVGFRVDYLVHRLSCHLVEHRDLPMVKKWTMAMTHELTTALQQLVYQDVTSGEWDRRCHAGFSPEAFFTKSVYQSLICPMVLAARGMVPRPANSRLVNPWTAPDYFQPGPIKTALMFRRTHFYVNSGVLAVHGRLVGRLTQEIVFSAEMQHFCATANLVPGRVLISVLNWLYPGGPEPETAVLKPALILCHDAGWQRAKERLEQRLLHEPTMRTQQLAEQLIFAERFGLENWMRALLLRIESTTYAQMAKELLDRPDGGGGLSERTRRLMQKQLADGWSRRPFNAKTHYWAIGVRRPTTHRGRVVSKAEEKSPDLDAQMTLAGLDSHYVLGEDVVQLTAV